MAPHLDTAKSTKISPEVDRISRRKAMKHMVEKRRRNKMNNLLEDMKMLVLQGMNKDPSQYEKMEKADILEMTLQFLMSSSKKQPKTPIALQPLSMPVPVAMSPALPLQLPNYGLGYQSCLSETQRYLQTAAVSSDVTSRLMGHLQGAGERRVQGQGQGHSSCNTNRKAPKSFDKQLEISIPNEGLKFVSSAKSEQVQLLRTAKYENSSRKYHGLLSSSNGSRRYNSASHSIVDDTDINNNVAVSRQVAVGAGSPQWRPW